MALRPARANQGRGCGPCSVVTDQRAAAGLAGGAGTGTLVAVKMLKEEVVETSPSALASFKREASLLESLRHPNIISFYGSCLDTKPVRFFTSACTCSEVGVLYACLVMHFNNSSCMTQLLTFVMAEARTPCAHR